MKQARRCICCGNKDLRSHPAMLAQFVADRVWGWHPFKVTGLYSDVEVVASPVCRSMFCDKCGAIFCDIRFDDDEMRRLYQDYRGKEYTDLRNMYEPGYAALNEKMVSEGQPYIAEIEDLIRPHLGLGLQMILDWGGDSGINTPFKEWPADIYDIGRIKPLFGRAVRKPNPPYDLVICSNLLEHVSYPSRLLGKIKKVMVKGTLLYVEVPDVYEDTHLWHEHINMFTLYSLQKLFERNGLEVLDYKHIDLGKYGQHLILCKEVR